MGFSNFLSQVALGAGRQIIYNQAQEDRRVDLEQKRTATAINQERLAELQSQKQAQKAIADVMNAGQAGDKASVQTPQDKAKLYQKAAEAASVHNPELASRMANLAKGQLDLAKDAETEVHKKITAAKENLAQTAISFAQNPSLEGQTEVAKAAMAAGIPMAQIPPPGSPSFAAWAKQQEVAGMASKDILASREKVREFEQRREDQQKEWESRNKDRDASRAQTAAIAQGNQELRRMMAESTIQAREEKTARGGKMSQLREQSMERAISAGTNLAMALERFDALSPGATASMFDGLKGDDLTKALTKAGTTKMTPEATQVATAILSGVAKDAANMIGALEGGRGFTEAQTKQWALGLPQPGDTELTVLFKTTAIKEEMEALLKHRKPSDPGVEAMRQELLAKVKPGSFGTLDMIKAMKSQGKSGELSKLLAVQNSIKDGTKALQDIAKRQAAGTEPAAGAGAGGGTGGSGGSSHPSDIQAILDAQRKGK